MRVMVLVKASAASEAGAMPSTELLTEMGNFNEQLVQAGVMLAGEGLHPTSKGKRVACLGKDRRVIDGPFPETKELIAGYWLWQVKSMDEAIDWVRRSPFQEGEIEIRPVFEAADFGAEFTPELQLQEAGLVNQIALQSSQITPYLFFGGRCEEALAFYRNAVGATIGMMMRFNESPDPVPDGMLQSGFENKIMHSEFTVGQTRVMASDGCNENEKFSGFRLALQVKSEDAARQIFAALGANGTVEMPLTPTFWSPLFGMLSDQFGLGWMVMVPMPCS